MAMNSVKKIGTVPGTKDAAAEKILSITKTRKDTTAEMQKELDGVVLRYEQLTAKLLSQSIEEIVVFLLNDDSATAKEMRELLKKGRLETYNYPGDATHTLVEAGLMQTFVPPSSLWADVDTYETDPTYYVLTPFGSNVASKIKELAEQRNKLRTEP